ncbi:hypothetical protein PLEOSDRAFT_1105252 [Pleurotus ostreatus PC15]|uniref:Uncharacterized protein n=1 Tax=Pleurotus ostreatus (strain PC15) TaxID=1137138 RepID=A0A067NEW5_PLEO1|nr:hypothetical protein PLEOSDRAFT_1105252 [Pleurotus ostreatus PC15]
MLLWIIDTNAVEQENGSLAGQTSQGTSRITFVSRPTRRESHGSTAIANKAELELDPKAVLMANLPSLMVAAKEGPQEQESHALTTLDAEALSAVLLDVRRLEEMAQVYAAGIATPELELDFELLCYRFRSLRTLKIWSTIDMLHLMLPIFHFCDRKEVVLLLYLHSTPSANIPSGAR